MTWFAVIIPAVPCFFEIASAVRALKKIGSVRIPFLFAWRAIFFAGSIPKIGAPALFKIL
jgi:hypothetical protein